MSERPPRRVRLRRTKGWRKPPDAVVVARPSRWGNPLRFVDDDGAKAAEWFAVCLDRRRAGTLPENHPFHRYPSDEEIRAHLEGRDLACWCPLVDPDGERVPCHADVLLELANTQEATDE